MYSDKYIEMANETLITIAKRTGYSISTISRVMSGQANKYRISDKTVEIIQNEAKRCNYIPSLLAKGLRMNRSNTIGLLIPSLDNPYFSNMASTIITEAKASGFTIVLVNSMENEANEIECLQLLMSRRVDGIIAVPSGLNPKPFERIVEQGVSIVLVDRYFTNTKLSYVCTDNYQGAVDATTHLIEHGHNRILCIQGPSYQTPVIERVRGFMDTMAKNGLNEFAHLSGEDFSIQNGYLETKLALNHREKPTAIFALSNTIMLGVIKAIRESGLRIPEDISVVSFDNNIFIDFLDPAITHVSQPVHEIGTLALKLVVQGINNRSKTEPNHSPVITQIQLPPKLTICKSVKHM